MHDQTDRATSPKSSRPAGIVLRPVFSASTPITPPDPQRGICPTCGMWAKLPDVAQVQADTMHAAQVAALGSNIEKFDSAVEGMTEHERRQKAPWLRRAAE